MDNEHLWDRIEERSKLWFHFQQPRNISMFAPRRLGKSWLMKNLLLKEAASKGWSAIYCDLQHANSYQKAVEALIHDLQQSADIKENLLNVVKTTFKEVLTGNIKSFKDILAQTDPDKLLDVILSYLNNRTDGKPVLILLDEVTVCASNIMKISIDDGQLLLNMLRKVRDAYPKICWMLTGSIGMDHFTRQYNMSGVFNNLHPFLIEPFKQDIAIAFVTDFCNNKVMNPFVLEADVHLHLQKRVGWLSPYYLEKLCLQIQPSEQNEDVMAATIADIDKACNTLLQHPHNQVFSGWPDHLERNVHNDIRPVCKVILKYICTSEAGESRDTIRTKLTPEYTPEQITEALIMLQNDGFIRKNQKNKFHFSMQLLADYWQEYQI